MLRLLLGALKGLAIGLAVGFAAHKLGLGGAWGYLVYGVIGLMVGLLVGRPIWGHLLDPKGTVFTAILKGAFGFGIGVLLFLLGRRVLGNPVLDIAGEARPLTDWSMVFGAAVGLLYGSWVEIDDAKTGEKKAGDKAGDQAGKRTSK
ncbi:MAG: hypothetical protein V2A73_23115 [Pseudomonadota bacterium]